MKTHCKHLDIYAFWSLIVEGFLGFWVKLVWYEVL